MSNRPKALIFLDADVVIRHFLDSGVLSKLIDSFETTLVFPPKEWNRTVNTININQWKTNAIRVAIPSRRRQFLKWLFLIDQAQHRWDSEWRAVRRSWLELLSKKERLLFQILGLPLVSIMATWRIKKYINQFPATDFDAFVKSEAPNLLIHPSTFEGYFINDLMRISSEMKIPLMLLMNSWDNPVLKRSVVGQPTAVVVWGPQTKRYAEKFMSIPEERIHIFGAAQFEIFKTEPKRTRAEICRLNGIPQEAQIILYAGSSKDSLESKHLLMLDDSIEGGYISDSTCKVLYRPHPYGLAAEEAAKILDTKFKHIIIEQAMRVFLMQVSQKQNRGFYNTPYQDTHDLLSSIDAIISPLSTILIEAGLHGKPAMCFVPEEEMSITWLKIMGLVCFQELMQNPKIILSKSYDTYLDSVHLLVKRAKDRREQSEIQLAMEFFVASPKLPYSSAIQRLAHELIEHKRLA